MRMLMLAVATLAILSAGCGSKPEPKAPDAPRPDPEEGPPVDPNADPLFTAATRICRLVDHKDEGIIAVAFAPEYFDTTPPTRLDDALHEVRTALGLCSERMKVVERVSPVEGIVGVECEHGVLLLSIGLADTPHKPMLAFGYQVRPGTTLRDMQKQTAPR
jgi:hypothetical protein